MVRYDKKFKDTKFGHQLWITGDNVKHFGEGIGKEATRLLHTEEDAIGNISKGVGGVGQGIGSGLKIMNNNLFF